CTRTSSWKALVSFETSSGCCTRPFSVVSRNSSSVSFSLWPRTNCSTGESSPGIAISAKLADFAREYSVGLNCTWMNSGSPRPGSTAPLSRISIIAFTRAMATAPSVRPQRRQGTAEERSVVAPLVLLRLRFLRLQPGCHQADDFLHLLRGEIPGLPHPDGA